MPELYNLSRKEVPVIGKKSHVLTQTDDLFNLLEERRIVL